MNEQSETDIPKTLRLQFRFLPLLFLSLAIFGVLFLQYLQSLLVIYVLISTYLSILFVRAKKQKYAAGNLFLLSALMLYLLLIVDSDLSRMLVWIMLNTGSAFLGFYAYLNSYSGEAKA